MIDLYYWTTPNGHKITIFLEETGLAYKIVPVNISKGDQFKPEFPRDLAQQSHSRDRGSWSRRRRRASRPCSSPERSCSISPKRPVSSCRAICAGDTKSYSGCSGRWAGSDPMAGQNHHFSQYAPEKIPYAIDRYVKETNRLYGVLNKRLADRAFIAGDYSIADMAAYPWIVPHRAPGPEARGLSPPQAMVRDDPQPARDGARL